MNANVPSPPDTEEVSAELLLGIANGDAAAFESFVRDHHRLVFSVAYRILNQPEDAEDVAQEVFTSLWHKAGLYDAQRGKPRTWLISMTRNRAIDRLRAKQRRAQLHDELQAEREPEDWSQEQEHALAAVERGEESEVLRSAVMRLSPEQRQVIEMTYFSGLSQSEAAKALGTPLGTVKARARRGLIRLRSLVARAHLVASPAIRRA